MIARSLCLKKPTTLWVVLSSVYLVEDGVHIGFQQQNQETPMSTFHIWFLKYVLHFTWKGNINSCSKQKPDSESSTCRNSVCFFKKKWGHILEYMCSHLCCISSEAFSQVSYRQFTLDWFLGDIFVLISVLSSCCQSFLISSVAGLCYASKYILQI